MMQKVYFSVKKSWGDDSPTRGVGYITETDLIAALISKANKPYVRIFEDCIKRCNKVTDKPNEYKGTYEEFYEQDGRDYQVSYDIWFRPID